MKNLLLKVTVAMAVMACVGSAYAVATLTLFDGTNTISITDNGPGDSNPALGAVAFIGAIGVWDANIDQGITKPLASPGEMDLAFQAHSTGSGTLTITFSDSGFSGLTTLFDSIGGTRAFGGTVTDNILVNGVVVMTLGPFGPGSLPHFGDDTSALVNLTPTDVVSLQVIIHHTVRGTSSGDKNLTGLTVPDGGSAVALLGIALTGIEAARRLLRARRA